MRIRIHNTTLNFMYPGTSSSTIFWPGKQMKMSLFVVAGKRIQPNIKIVDNSTFSVPLNKPVAACWLSPCGGLKLLEAV
jgi:hypothetical protein